jgi:predicted ATP-dependent endonuclease of OLD family
MQIWLQLLLHVFRLRARDIIVLDEPDVFLHSDLQRRLVNLLENVEAQTVTATHSAEVISEAPDEAVIWISRERRNAVKAPGHKVLFELSSALGTQFNLPLAKALKTKVVAFVEGQDAKVLRRMAKTLGHKKIAHEDGIAIVPLRGFDHWVQIEPFKWLMDEFLEDAVIVHVVLDRDYRGEEAVARIRRKLREIGVQPHIWKRKELENYLLNPTALARLADADEGWIRSTLDECAVELENEVYAQIFSEEALQHKRSGKSQKTLSKEAKERADALWKEPSRRLAVCSGKDLLRLLNGRLEKADKRSVTMRGLAARMHPSEMSEELKRLLASIEDDAA